jgi:hypothetical protein
MQAGTDVVCNEEANIDARIAMPLELIRGFLKEFGRRAESLVEYHPLGIDGPTIRRHMANIEAELARLRALGDRAFADVPPEVLRPEVLAAWNSKKNLRYATGSLMMTERFRADMSPENRTRAFSTKVLYECVLDALDDCIDTESYSFEDALDLMRHCVSALTTDSFDATSFREELRPRLAPEQRHMTDFLTALVAGTNHAIGKAPHGREMRGKLDRFHENWILGQAYTMYQKDPTFDVRAFLAACEQFPAPDEDLNGIERISGWISHTAAITLIDLCFVDHLLSPSAMAEHMTAWFYFDAVVTLLNNIADPSKDLDEGIANLFIIARAEGQLSGLRRVRGIRPSLTMSDYEAFLERAAEFAGRLLMHAAASGDDPEAFYRFIAVMAPLVMLTDEHGTKEDLLHAYLRAFSRVVAGSPERRMELTIPRRTRSGRTRSGRTASSSPSP